MTSHFFAFIPTFLAALTNMSQINFKLSCCNLEGPSESSLYPYFQLHFLYLTCPPLPRSIPWFQVQINPIKLSNQSMNFSMKYIEDFVCMWNFQGPDRKIPAIFWENFGKIDLLIHIFFCCCKFFITLLLIIFLYVTYYSLSMSICLFLSLTWNILKPTEDCYH